MATPELFRSVNKVFLGSMLLITPDNQALLPASIAAWQAFAPTQTGQTSQQSEDCLSNLDKTELNKVSAGEGRIRPLYNSEINAMLGTKCPDGFSYMPPVAVNGAAPSVAAENKAPALPSQSVQSTPESSAAQVVAPTAPVEVESVGQPAVQSLNAGAVQDRSNGGSFAQAATFFSCASATLGVLALGFYKMVAGSSRGQSRSRSHGGAMAVARAEKKRTRRPDTYEPEPSPQKNGETRSINGDEVPVALIQKREKEGREWRDDPRANREEYGAFKRKYWHIHALARQLFATHDLDFNRFAVKNYRLTPRCQKIVLDNAQKKVTKEAEILDGCAISSDYAAYLKQVQTWTESAHHADKLIAVDPKGLPRDLKRVVEDYQNAQSRSQGYRERVENSDRYNI